MMKLLSNFMVNFLLRSTIAVFLKYFLLTSKVGVKEEYVRSKFSKNYPCIES